MESKELEREIIQIRELLENNNDNGNGVIFEDRKFPDSHLIFEESQIDVQVATQGYDSNYYVVDSNGVLKRYDSLINGKDSIEEGFTWNVNNGELIFLICLPEGFTFFANSSDQARIYHSEDINSTPQLVYESNTTSNSRWRRDFGVKSYYNGSSFILAGVYGSGPEKRDLLLSSDGGLSFDVIKQTLNLDNSNDYNSHWHDVGFDPYHGYFWASEGDGPINRHVHFTDDSGESWVSTQDRGQPTSIIPFPDRVVFGRDGGRVGLSYYIKPLTLDNSNFEIKTLREFRGDVEGYQYYGRMPLVKGNEAYMSFHLQTGVNYPIILGTGDFGKTWHGLFMSTENIGNFISMDNEYIYAYNENNDKIIYTKKPNWI